MAIARNNVKKFATNANNYNYDYDAGSGSGRVLVVMVNTLYNEISEIKYDGVSLTKADGIYYGDYDGVYIFYLVNPSSGSNTLAITSSSTDRHAVVMFYLTGSKASGSPLGQTGTVTTSGYETSTSLTLTGVKKDSMVLALNYIDSSSTYSLTNDMELIDSNSVTYGDTQYSVASYKSISADGNTNVGISKNSGLWRLSIVAVEFLIDPVVAPTVTTQDASDIAKTSVTGNGNITATGGANATRRGFCYKAGTSGDPTTADSVAYDDGDFGTGAYTKSITGLSPNTSYRVRAYAVNSAGTSYGSTVDVKTLSSFIPRTMWFN